jgi:hypothetical protein
MSREILTRILIEYVNKIQSCVTQDEWVDICFISEVLLDHFVASHAGSLLFSLPLQHEATPTRRRRWQLQRLNRTDVD